MPTSLRQALGAAVLLVIAFLGLHALGPTSPSGDPVGTQDFVAYWSAWDVTTSGGDPYAEADLAEAQAPLQLQALDEVQRFWNPPWALVVLAPVLWLPFDVAAEVWLLLSVVAGAACGVLGWRLLRPGEAVPPLAVAGGLLFAPFLEALLLGQLGAVMGAFVLGALVCVRERRDVGAGVLLALVAMKPQAFLVVLAVLALHLLRGRRWRVLATAAGATGALVAASAVVVPSAWSGWDPVGGSPTHWRTPTLAGWMRTLVSDLDPPSWPLLAVPLAGAVVAVAWYLRRPDGEDWWPAVPTLLGASILLAPYTWIFDAAPMLAVQVLIIGGAVLGDHVDRRLLVGVVAVNSLALWWRSLPSTSHEDLLVTLLAVLVLAVVHRVAHARAPSGVLDG